MSTENGLKFDLKNATKSSSFLRSKNNFVLLKSFETPLVMLPMKLLGAGFALLLPELKHNFGPKSVVVCSSSFPRWSRLPRPAGRGRARASPGGGRW